MPSGVYGRASPTERLMSKIKMNPNSECWEWTGVLNSGGYGLIKVDGRLRTTHRLSYEIYCGPIPEELHVLHTCDNRVCTNPKHLFLGTNADNVADKIAKGRQRYGTSSKLTDADVIAIRAADGVTHKALAEFYGVTRPHISKLRSGKGWGA